MDKNTDKTPLDEAAKTYAFRNCQTYFMRGRSDYEPILNAYKEGATSEAAKAYCQSKQAAGEVNKIDWVERYSTLREESNMPDAINKMIKEYASQFTPQTGAATKLEWVRANKRLPPMYKEVEWRNADGGNIPLGKWSTIDMFNKSGPNINFFEWLDENSPTAEPVNDHLS